MCSRNRDASRSTASATARHNSCPDGFPWTTHTSRSSSAAAVTPDTLLMAATTASRASDSIGPSLTNSNAETVTVHGHSSSGSSSIASTPRTSCSSGHRIQPSTPSISSSGIRRTSSLISRRTTASSKAAAVGAGDGAVGCLASATHANLGSPRRSASTTAARTSSTEIPSTRAISGGSIPLSRRVITCSTMSTGTTSLPNERPDGAQLAGRRAVCQALDIGTYRAGDWCQRSSANTRELPGTPLSSCSPRSSNSKPLPATRSVTVRLTSTSPGAARLEMR